MSYLRDSLGFLALNRPSRRTYVPAATEGSGVPRIIHQTHRSFDALPAEVRDSIAALRARNPGWEYRFYNDENAAAFILSEYGARVLRYWNRIDPAYGAARADFFRYLLVYRAGGAYLDIKSSALLPLDQVVLPGDRLVLAQWPKEGRFEGAGRHESEFAGKIEGGEFQQWHVICAPGHPYLRAVIQAVMRNIDCYVPGLHGSGRHAVLRVTGPIAYTLAMLPLLPSGAHRLVADHRELGLEYSVYSGNSEHKRLFGGHYSELTAPVVRASPVRRALGAAYFLARRARGKQGGG